LSEDVQEGFHLGRRDGGQSIRLAAARSPAGAIGG
jgi:hypothetical protein